MKKYLYIILILVLPIVFIVAGSRFILPRFLSAYLGKQFKADVRIEEATLNIKDGIRANNIFISSKRGLQCNIERGVITPSLWGASLSFKFKNVNLSYPNSKVINSITEILSMPPMERLQFNSVKGKFYGRKKEVIIKSLNAEGRFIRLFADGTIANNSRVNCSIKILLSGKLIAEIPEPTRRLFFKQGGAWSEVELYLSGDINRPSINFSTDLFKLTVR